MAKKASCSTLGIINKELIINICTKMTFFVGWTYINVKIGKEIRASKNSFVLFKSQQIPGFNKVIYLACLYWHAFCISLEVTSGRAVAIGVEP